MNRRRLISAAAVLALVPAAPVHAQTGVHVDAGSPSDKEYAIPLDSARRDAASGGNGDLGSSPGTSGSAPAPLFGEGVGNASGDSPKGTGRRGQRSSTSGDGASSGPTVNDAITGTQPVRATVPAGGAKSTLTIGALALSVLLLGGVLGSIARRRQG
jgi:hypothetical protein